MKDEFGINAQENLRSPVFCACTLLTVNLLSFPWNERYVMLYPNMVLMSQAAVEEKELFMKAIFRFYSVE